MQTPGGARICFRGSPDAEALEGLDDTHVLVCGKACEAAGHDRLQRFLEWAVANGGKATRIDLAADDYKRRVTPGFVLGQWTAEARVSRSRKWRRTESGEAGKSEIGETVTLGSPTSRVQARIYDKAVQSKGRVNAVRWEIQSREEAAETLLAQLAESGGAWGALWAARLTAFVDFRQGADKNVSRRPRCPWFSALVGLARKAKIYPPKALKSLREITDWFRKAMGPTLGLLRLGCPSTLDDVIDEGRGRLRSRHRRILVAAGVTS